MGLLIAAGALILGFGTAYVASDNVRYLTRAGFEESRILMHRQPIAHLARDSATSPALRELANLVLSARTFAAKLGLEAKDTYTSYSDVGRDTLLLVLTASPKTCLCPVTWKYPIAGRVPYKGFFDFKQARKAADKYAGMGYDVYLRPSPAFSTLGWFNDPLLSTAITTDSVELAATVFHEIAHNTLWVKGATDFNESFAQWVGYRAARAFFLSRGDSVLALRAEDRWHDERLLGDYYRALIGKLDTLYSQKLPTAQNDSGRAAIARWSFDTLSGPLGAQLRTVRLDRLQERPINNAALLGVLLYRTNLPLFSAWLGSYKDNLAVAVYALQQLLKDAEGDEAFRLMRSVLQSRGALLPE